MLDAYVHRRTNVFYIPCMQCGHPHRFGTNEETLKRWWENSLGKCRNEQCREQLFKAHYTIPIELEKLLEKIKHQVQLQRPALYL